MKSVLFASALSLLLSACTITHYKRISPDGEQIDLSNYSMGMERKDIDMSFEKQGEVSAKVKIGNSNGSESFNKAADSLIEAGKLMKSVNGMP